MATLFDSASLVMLPSGYKDQKLYSIKPTDGSGDFTFSRDGAGASPATRVNASGLIEKGRENQVLQSNAFDQVEWPLQSATITGGQSGYDGTNDAWLLDASAAGGNIRQGSSVSGVNTFSIYAKAGTADGIRVRFDQTTDTNVYVDLTDGSVHTAINDITTTTENIGGGWYRVVFAMLNAGLSLLRIYPTDGGTNAIAGTIYIQDAQLEQGLVATDYIETTTAPVSAGLLGDMPRLDYSGGATCPSLLLEPSRVNLVANSEYLNGADWTKTNVTITNNATTSPDGGANASKWVASAVSGSKTIYNFISTSNAAHTAMGYFKADEYPLAFLRLGGIAGNPYVIYNLSTQSVVSTSSLTSHSIEDAGNGWYKITATATTGSSLIAPNYSFIPSSGYTLDAQNVPQFTGDGTSGGFLWGCQCEVGAYATSLIPTYGSASTRGADDCSKTGIGSVFGSSVGTLFFEGVYGNEANEIYLFAQNVLGSTTENSIYLQRSGAASIQTQVWNGATQEVVISGGSVSVGDTFKVAVAFANNDVVLYLNGTQIGTDTSVTIPPLTSLQIGKYPASAADNYRISDGVKQALVFPTRLTNAELAALTA